jgi:hypothetical protein
VWGEGGPRWWVMRTLGLVQVLDHRHAVNAGKSGSTTWRLTFAIMATIKLSAYRVCSPSCVMRTL